MGAKLVTIPYEKDYIKDKNDVIIRIENNCEICLIDTKTEEISKIEQSQQEPHVKQEENKASASVVLDQSTLEETSKQPGD